MLSPSAAFAAASLLALRLGVVLCNRAVVEFWHALSTTRMTLAVMGHGKHAPMTLDLIENVEKRFKEGQHGER
jgi:hypothetical protein